MSTLFYSIRHREVNGIYKNWTEIDLSSTNFRLWFSDQNLDKYLLTTSTRDLCSVANNESQTQNNNKKGLKQTGDFIFRMKSGRGMLVSIDQQIIMIRSEVPEILLISWSPYGCTVVPPNLCPCSRQE